jgi:GNAT acetyltransferase-like protein
MDPSVTFVLVDEPGDDLLAALAALAPDNPFQTREYARTRRMLEGRLQVIGLESGGRLASGCLAIRCTGRLADTLEIPSLCAVSRPALFWSGLGRALKRGRAVLVKVRSFASPPGEIPRQADEVDRYPRREYVVDLQPDRPGPGLSTNHARNVRRAEGAGVTVVWTASPAARASHHRLVERSLARRRARGETAGAGVSALFVDAALDSGAGELVQAVRADDVLSSVLVLLAPQGAYYHSAGTDPEGMRMGASHLLLSRAADELRRRSIAIFNLGGVDAEADGLARFKAGFGSRIVDSTAVDFLAGSFARRRLWRVAGHVRGALRRRSPPGSTTRS